MVRSPELGLKEPGKITNSYETYLNWCSISFSLLKGFSIQAHSLVILLFLGTKQHTESSDLVGWCICTLYTALNFWKSFFWFKMSMGFYSGWISFLFLFFLGKYSGWMYEIYHFAAIFVLVWLATICILLMQARLMSRKEDAFLSSPSKDYWVRLSWISYQVYTWSSWECILMSCIWSYSFLLGCFARWYQVTCFLIYTSFN